MGGRDAATAGTAAGRPPRPGRHWVVTAVAMPVVPVLIWLTFHRVSAYEACLRVHGPGSTDRVVNGARGQCYTVTMQSGLALVAVLAAVALTILVGVVLGVVDGRSRRTFGHGRWVCVAVIGLTGPWALLAYALGYGPARLLPVRRPSPPPPPDPMMLQGWQAAIQLYRRLAAGQSPPTVITPGFLATEPVYLDASFIFARFYGTTVTYGQSSTVAFGSPVIVAGALIGNMIGNSAARTQAQNQARPQWRVHQHARTVVTPTRTWCCVDAQWIAFEHAAVMEYTLDGAACVLAFAGTDPLRLFGAAAWCHAVLFAYARYGPSRWQEAPFLHPIRMAAEHTSPTGVVHAPL